MAAVRQVEYPTESETRREGARPDVPVVLADGATWHFPAVGVGRLELGVSGRFDEVRSVFADGSFAPSEVTEAMALMEDVSGARGDRTPGPSVIGCLSMLAASLLRTNYDVTPWQAMMLVRHGFELDGRFHGLALVHAAVAAAIDRESIEARRASIARNPRDN